MTLMLGRLALPFALLFSLFGFVPALRQNPSSSRLEWMKDLDDGTLLRNIAIPGTHDTMALYSIANLSGKCQSLSLEDQLNLGARFLDIRLDLSGNTLKAVHGIVDQRRDFSSINKAIVDFLTNHPTETLLVSIKQESKGDSVPFEEALKKELKDLWRTSSTLPSTLGEVRGKAVLFSRYAAPTIGVPCYTGWLDSNSFSLPNDIYVQDEYKVKDIVVKKEAIANCFAETGHALKINFLSGYKTSSFPPSYAPSVANEINPWIKEEIKNKNDKGIVLFDFLTTELMEAFFHE